MSETPQQSALERLDKADQIRKDAIKDLLTERKHLEVKLADIDAVLTKYGQSPDPVAKKDSKDDKRKKRVRLDNETILSYIGTKSVQAADIEKDFGCSYQTATKKLKELVKSKALKTHKDGLKVIYSYKGSK